MLYLKTLMITLMALIISACGINNIPTYDEDTTAKWSQVLNQYKRRADLIPNLVKTVKGYAAHEKEVFVEVTNARAKVGQMTIDEKVLSDPAAFKQFEAAQSKLSSALSRLLLVAERYPDLKANQNFLQLQSQLEGAENRISVARRDYIESVRRYNTELRTIPGRWWKSLLYSDAQAKQQFSVPESENVQQVPTVEF